MTQDDHPPHYENQEEKQVPQAPNWLWDFTELDQPEEAETHNPRILDFWWRILACQTKIAKFLPCGYIGWFIKSI